MLKTIQRMTISTFLLLLMPLGVWFSGWTWQPEKSGNILCVMFWITETVTSPWGKITSLMLSSWVLWCLRCRLRHSLILFVIMNSAILVGHYTKSYIKEQVQEPRPYVVWLKCSHGIREDQFYHLKQKERSQMVSMLLAHDTRLPQWLKNHWAFETSFAFPSGHTMFAASWVLLVVGLLWPRRHIATVIVLFLWATMVMSSRLLLGMHWPLDLVMATLLSWLLVTLAMWLVQCFCGPLTLKLEDEK